MASSAMSRAMKILFISAFLAPAVFGQTAQQVQANLNTLNASTSAAIRVLTEFGNKTANAVKFEEFRANLRENELATGLSNAAVQVIKASAAIQATRSSLTGEISRASTVEKSLASQLNSLSYMQTALTNVDASLAASMNRNALVADGQTLSRALVADGSIQRVSSLALAAVIANFSAQHSQHVASITSINSSITQISSAVETLNVNTMALNNSIVAIEATVSSMTALNGENTQQTEMITAEQVKNDEQDALIAALQDGQTQQGVDIDALNTSIAGLQANTGVDINALNISIIAANTKNTEQDTSLTNVQNKNTEQDTSLTNVQNKNTEQDTSLTNVQNKNTEQGVDIDALNTSIAGLQANTGVDINALNISIIAALTKNSVQDNNLTALQNKNTAQDVQFSEASSALKLEISRAIFEEDDLNISQLSIASVLKQEVSRSIVFNFTDSSIAARLSQEITRSVSIDSSMANDALYHITLLHTTDNNIRASLNVETARAVTAEGDTSTSIVLLTSSLTNERTRAIGIESSLSNAIGGTDSSLALSVQKEFQRAFSVESNLQTQIDTLRGHTHTRRSILESPTDAQPFELHTEQPSSSEAPPVVLSLRSLRDEVVSVRSESSLAFAIAQQQTAQQVLAMRSFVASLASDVAVLKQAVKGLKEYLAGFPQDLHTTWSLRNSHLSPCSSCSPVHETICKAMPTEDFEKSFGFKMFRLRTAIDSFVAQSPATINALPFAVDVKDTSDPACLSISITPSTLQTGPISIMQALNSTLQTSSVFRESATNRNDQASSPSLSVPMMTFLVCANLVFSLVLMALLFFVWRSPRVQLSPVELTLGQKL